MVLYEEYKIVSLAFPIMKKIVLFPSLVRFPVKLICCISLGSVSSVCYLLKSITIML